MEKVTVIYIIAISLQLAGAVILIINYCRNTHNQIIDRYFPGSNLVERDNKDNIVLEKERVQEVVREIFMNRCAFFYIGAGYIVGIYGEAGKTNKCIISILVIIGSFLLIVLGEIILNGIVKKRYKEDMEIPYNSVASKADALPTEKGWQSHIIKHHAAWRLLSSSSRRHNGNSEVYSHA